MTARKEHIEVERPLRGKETVELGEDFLLLGRSPSCDVWLRDGRVSRHHARMERGADGLWRLWDLHSMHGTLVNGRRTEMAVLADGDRVLLGGCQLTFRSGAEPTAAVAHAYTVVAEDTITVEVDGYAIVEEVPPTADVLKNLHDALRRVSRARTIEHLWALLAEEFRHALLPKRIAIGVAREDGYAWPYGCDGDGKEVDVEDLGDRLKPRLKGMDGSQVLQWVTVRSGTQAFPADAKKRLVLLFPMKSVVRHVAHIYVEFRRAEQVPPLESVEMLALLVREASLLWENLELEEHWTELHEEVLRARAIQVRLFPSAYELDPRIEIAGENIPCMWVSGDCYDFQKLGDGRVAFLIGDVMGHGLSAALLMANVQAVFRTGIRFGWDLDEIDVCLEQVVAANSTPGTFVTGLLGVCDLGASKLYLLSAGHRWPSLVLAGEQAEFGEAGHRFSWGTGVERTGGLAEFELPKSDWSLIAYTDGLKKPSDKLGQSYPVTSIPSLQGQLRSRSADELCEAVLRDVFAFADKAHVLTDDITLLVMRGGR